MKITINGNAEELKQDSLTVTELLKEKDVDMPEMVSVEYNGEILDRDKFDTTTVKEGDAVEFLYFMGGGATQTQEKRDYRFYELPETLPQEIDKFEEDIREYMTGNIEPVKFKAIRVAHGVYEQRQEHTYMIRIRCAACGITPKQLKKVAELGQRFGSDEVHFTTRSEVQIHNVLMKDVPTVIRELPTVGLSSRGGGGNTIRNILTSPDSGIKPDEAFDVDPYAIALTTALIKEQDSWNLPRKFKIAFSNDSNDTAFTQATCLGYVAQVNDQGERGFKVYCAGGMGAKPMIGNLLFDWIPENHVYHVARAMKVMFDKHGNRRSKTSSRIKFLWDKLQREEFERLFHEEYDKIKDDRSLDLMIEEMDYSARTDLLEAEQPSDQAKYDLWRKRYVSEQKQEGLFTIKIPLRLGDLRRVDADKLCDALDKISENSIRCDRGQNMRLRNIPEVYLPNMFNIIDTMESHLSDFAPFIGNMINCTGASTCKLGIALPRGLSDAIRNRLDQSNLDLDQLTDFRLNMSGCPNTCGLHHIAHLGFYGKVGRTPSRDMYPAYYVLTGGDIKLGATKYAQKQGEIAAKHLPNFVHDFLENWLLQRDEYKDYYEYLEEEGNQLVATLLEKYKDVPEFDEGPEFFTDWGAKKRMTLDELGTAECAAGLFDMINVDKNYIRGYKKELGSETEQEKINDLLHKILFHASRMLLVTRGLDPKTETQVFELFAKHFIDTNIVDKKYLDVVTLGKLGVKAELPKHADLIQELADTINDLYKNMDDSLKFHTEKADEKAAKNAPKKTDQFKDYRGVACPMNFVKTKLVLETMSSGQTLEVFLDDGEPIQNVPNSVKLEGHAILEQERSSDGYWSVVIKKK